MITQQIDKKQILRFILWFLPLLIVYIDWFHYGFISIDDGGQVFENPKVHSLSLENFKLIFTSATVGMYQPLTSFSFALLVSLFGFKTALPFHIFSFLLHCANTTLVFKLGKKLVPNNININLLPLLFALHPLTVEAVAWVSATSTLLFTLFFLLATLQYLKYLEKGTRKNYYYCLLFFIVGCFAKVQILPFVGVLFLLDYLRDNSLFNKKRFLEKIPFLAIAILFAYITFSFRGGQSGFTKEIYDYNPLFLTPTQIAWYISKLFIPLRLGIIYDWPSEFFSPWFYISIIILIGLIILTYLNRKNRLFVFGVLFFLANIILHTTIFSKFLGPYADRYGYLSSIGIWLATFSLLKTKRQFENNLVIFIIIGGFLVLSKIQVSYWKDTLTLWSNNLKYQNASFSNGMRGYLYYEKKMYKEAKADFEKVHKKPDYRLSPEKYGFLYNALGLMTSEENPQKSAMYFSLAAKKSPSFVSFQNTGTAYQKIKEYDKAEEYFLKCLNYQKHQKFYLNLSSLYFESQQYEKGITILTDAIDSGFQELIFYKMRCFFRIEEKQFELAAQDYKTAISLLNQKDNNNSDTDLAKLKIKLKNYL